ncbi:LamG-like jellyroll fold domain-containing protein [Nitrospirillum sp. BR 11828]|uniref:LamG-like jellyroll fold domain-containing protein n=1 Tax=Nitrospirillum sp. BR 11828 TaxID=3104325 RepID=UPI002ACA08EB|nr:LamG-like jellyroll fold domain-containing protein [Nitrospirillum sp. BR 11828]MDZ5648940.1 LamG-like jellyroll fold domain-containing protein [Nitrospirillum sp. BR 11828]
MTDLATQVAGLTTSVNALTSAVNVAKATLDASVSAAGASAATAQAAVTTAASSAAAAQSAQAAAVAVSGLSSLNSFLGQIQAGAPAAVFWYDTTRDWDEGAWRKRCTWQSYINEPLNTATRGARASIPAEMLIMATATTVTIYDADQATPVMWMVVPAAFLGIVSGAAITCVTARDGVIYVGSSSGADGRLVSIDFLRDRGVIWTTGGQYWYPGGIASRSAPGTVYAVIGTPGVGASSAIAAVAVTVLPGAPLDRATGLPKPTVAVATVGGVSVIHQSGQVASITVSGGYQSAIITDGRLLATVLGRTDYGPVPYATLANSAWRLGWYDDSSSTPRLLAANQQRMATNAIAIGGVSGLTLMAEEPVNPANGMVAYVTGSGNTANGGGAFNSGWMVGDCRLALATTSTASTTGANIASWTSAAGTTGWSTTDGNLTLSISGSDLQMTETSATVTASKAIYQLSGCVVGQTYLVAINMRRGTVGAIMRAEVTDNGATMALAGGYTTSTTASTVLMQFRATDPSPKVRINFDAPYTAGQTGLVTSVSVDLAEPDRSAQAIGMRVIGALSKSVVASTADLSAWSGFSASNYLLQPYNPALDFGAGDFCVGGWINTSDTGSHFMTRVAVSAGAYTSTPGWRAFISAGQVAFDISADGFATVNRVTSAVAISGTGWRQWWAVSRSGSLELWLDGVRVATAIRTVGTLSNTAAQLWIGLTGLLTLPAGGTSLAQLRLSTTAPTPEQIARMYADERPLFQPGAKCVLGGTSAAVQGLAHDPDTGALYAAKGDGTSVFQGLVRTTHLTGLATTGNSDNHTAVAARQGGYVIATANQAVASLPSIVFRDRILADRVPVAPTDANRVVFPPAVTTDATPTVIARLPVAEGDELQLMVDVEATEYGAAPSERMGYQRRARVYRLPNGNVTVAAVQTLGTDYESATTTGDVTVVADTTSQTVCIQATGVAAKRLAWATLVHINRAGATRYAA